MKFTPPKEAKSEPEWLVFLKNLPKPLTLKELKERYSHYGMAREKAAALREILKVHEDCLTQVMKYINLETNKFCEIISGREIEVSNDRPPIDSTTFYFNPADIEFHTDGVTFKLLNNGSIFHTNEELTVEGVTSLKITKLFCNYVRAVDRMRADVEHEAAYFDRIAASELPPSKKITGADLARCLVKVTNDNEIMKIFETNANLIRQAARIFNEKPNSLEARFGEALGETLLNIDQKIAKILPQVKAKLLKERHES